VATTRRPGAGRDAIKFDFTLQVVTRMVAPTAARVLFPGLVRRLLSSKGAALAAPQSGGDASKGASGADGIGVAPPADQSRRAAVPS